ncbi:MAG: glycoside hydrolase family 11 protein, partial [Ruminococcus sp.]|nr:glycoside hydrolase family 11 protein [Ruminococcus sp.]
MKQGAINRFVSVFVTMMMTFTCFFVTPVNEVFAADQQELGNKDGFDYELWNQWGQGSVTMQVGSNGAFSCSWDGIENCLFRTGKKLEKTKKYSEYNGMYIDYDVDYEPKGNSYMCVYGWTENPTIEYYIVEAWGSWRPPGATDSLGTVEANGHTYDIYKTIRENQPSIHGTETFYQYWSVRQDNPAQNNVKKEITGRISVSKHFEAWEKAGLDMSGTMYEVALNIEGYQSNGSANVKKNGLVMGEGDGDGGSSIVTPPTPVEPDENGYFFHSDFESTVDSWGARGDASVKETSAETFAGNKSLGVTGRTDSWNGAARSLSTFVFVPGNSYSFSVAVMQNKTASEDFKLTLQYDKDGETNYSTIATATGAKGEWVQLANTSYTIPAGATNLIIYTETDGTTTDYFMDEAIGAEKGKVIDFSSSSSSKLGDLNGDGKIDAADLQELQNFILGKKATATLETSDMNSDGVINSFDLVLLRQTVLNPQQSTPSTPVATGSVDISWIDPSKPMVAISFDDGAVGTDANSSSMRILNALKNSGFHATFFYVSDWIRNNQAEVKTAYDMGMEVANHTKSHPNLSEKSASEIRSEYDSCATALKNIIGTEPSKLLRLPYLASNDTVKSTLSDVPLITCSIDTQDWNGATTSQIIDTVKNAMSNGSLNNAIVLCHETYDSTAEAMEYLCTYLKEQGWQIVT